MRRLIGSVVAVMLFAGAISSSQAAFTSISKMTSTAQVVFTAAGSVTASILLRNVADNSAAASIYWDPSEITLGGVTKWKRAKSYIQLTTNITSANGGVQIYTDNKAYDANPRYVNTISSAAAGLVESSQGLVTLPMCWRVTDISTTTLTINQGASAAQTIDGRAYPDRLWSQELGPNYPCFIWMKDRANVATPEGTAFVDGEDYVTVKDVRGIQHAEMTFGNTISPDYIYFGADFSTAMTPKTYKTSKLIVEAFTE